MTKQEDGSYTVVLGEFNTVNRNGHVYRITEEDLRANLNKLVGKPFGEIGPPDYSGIPEYWRPGRKQRFETVAGESVAGILRGCDILKGSHGDMAVLARVDLSEAMQRILNDAQDNQPRFSVRHQAVVHMWGEAPLIKDIIAFDYLSVAERELKLPKRPK